MGRGLVVTPETASRGPLVRFVVVTFAVSWAIALPLALHGLDLIAWNPPGWLHAAVPLGPAAGALAAIRTDTRPRARRELLARLRPSSVGSTSMWLLASSPLAVAIPVVALAAAVTDLDWAAAVRTGSYEVGPWPVAVVGVAVTFGVLEEVGWRGFLLPFWQTRHTAAAATWRLWIVWAVWHLPLFAYEYEVGPETLAWLVTLYFGSVWLTFLFNLTRGSLAATATWHVTYNLVSIAGGAISAALPAVVSGAIVLAALAVGRRYGPVDLAPRPRQALPPTTPSRSPTSLQTAP